MTGHFKDSFQVVLCFLAANLKNPQLLATAGASRASREVSIDGKVGHGVDVASNATRPIATSTRARI